MIYKDKKKVNLGKYYHLFNHSVLENFYDNNSEVEGSQSYVTGSNITAELSNN